MKGCHAGREIRQDDGPSLFIDVEDRSGSIADQHGAVRCKRKTAGETEIGRRNLMTPVVEHPIDGPIKTAGDVESAIGAESHRGHVDDARHEGFSRTTR